MFCTLILVAVLLCAAARAEECKGGWTRADAHLCVLRNLDQINDDGKIDAQEISQFKKKLISSATLLGSFGGWLEGQVEKILPHDWLAKYSTAEIQSRCADEEGYITMHSWEAKREHCINRCSDLEPFMSLCTKLDKDKIHYPHHKIDKLGAHLKRDSSDEDVDFEHDYSNAAE